MYGFIWRMLPGPTWLKVIEAIALVAIIIWLLFEYAFPWIMDNTNFGENTVG